MPAADLVEMDVGVVPLADDANYGVLPVDVLFDILLCLPVKELCRLRLVCRSWRSLTSDPLFARAHSRRRPHAVAVHRERHELHVVDLHDMTVVKKIRMIRLALPGFYLRTQLDLACVVHDKQWGRASVFNFNLQQGTGSAAIADLSVDDHGLRDRWYWRMQATPRYMLGHVRSTGEYKILRFYTPIANANQVPNSKRMCHVMTLGGSTGTEGRWRAIMPNPPVGLVLSSGRTAVVSGVAYFFLRSKQCWSRVLPDNIASFDLATEEWRSTMLKGPVLPTAKDDASWRTSDNQFVFLLIGVGDYLVTARYIPNDVPQRVMDLWFLEDLDKSIWTKRCSVRWTTVDMGFTAWPLMVLDDGKIIFWMFEAQVLGSYDRKTSSWVNVVKMENYLNTHMHHGSLLCSGLQHV